MKKIFLFIFLSYFVFFFLIPPFQEPDESSHYENVYWITQGIYPFVPESLTPNNHPYTEKIAPYFAIGINHPMLIPDFPAIAKSYEATRVSYSPQLTRTFLPISVQAYNPPVYYVIGAVFLKIAQLLHTSLLSQYYAVRFASALLYFGTVFLAYKIISILFKSPEVRKSLLIFFALNPLFINVGIGINPDIAITFFATLFLFLVMREQSKKNFFMKKKLIFFALILGIATLAKISGFFLVLSFLLYLFFLKQTFRQWIMASIILLIPFIFIQIPWALFNYARYHVFVVSEVALGPATNTLANPIPKAVIAAAFEFRHTFMHYAGFFGWNDIHPFSTIFIPYAITFFILLCCGIYVVWKEDNDKRNKLLVFSIGSLFLFFYFLSLERELFFPHWDIQGRYIMPIFFPMIICVAYGLAKITKRSIEHVAPYLFYFAIFYYFLSLIFTLLPRYYV